MAATDSRVHDEVRRFLEENFLLEARAAQLGETDSFIEHQVLDSTGFMELVAWLEERYGLRVADDEMLPENLDSVANVAVYIARKRAGPLDASRPVPAVASAPDLEEVSA